MMTGNVACLVDGCTGAVIGQCAGYGRECGRFYCAAHSEDGLCEECTERKRAEEERTQLFITYLAAAENVREPNFLSRLIFLILVAVAAVVLGGFMGGDLGEIGAGILVFGSIIAGGVLFNALFDKPAKERLRQYKETMPGFEEFYSTWKSQKNKEELATLIAVSVSTATAGKQVYDKHIRDQ